MFFGKPSIFEDSHDCEINVKLYAKNSDVRKYWHDELFIIDKDLELQFHKNGFWGNPQRFVALFNSMPQRKNADIFGIHCLCKNPLSQKMWEKYASNEGICIGYQTEEFGSSTCLHIKEDVYFDGMPLHYLPFLDVNYMDSSHPELNRLPTNRFMEEVKKALLIKDTCWSFEEEVRSFVFDGNIKMPLADKGIEMHCTDDSIQQIIFSNTISSETKKMVIDIIDNRQCGKNGVKFYQISANFDHLILL